MQKERINLSLVRARDQHFLWFWQPETQDLLASDQQSQWHNWRVRMSKSRGCQKCRLCFPGPSSTQDTSVAQDTFLPQSCNSSTRLKTLIKTLNGAKVSSQMLHTGGHEKLFERASKPETLLGGVDWNNLH